MAMVAVGVDLAKNVFAVHGVDETGKVVLLKEHGMAIYLRKSIRVGPLRFNLSKSGVASGYPQASKASA